MKQSIQLIKCHKNVIIKFCSKSGDGSDLLQSKGFLWLILISKRVVRGIFFPACFIDWLLVLTPQW